MPSAISVQHLTKRYDAVTALQDVSFDVAPGEIVGFLGPNGAGKTTTLRILTGMIEPTGGSAVLDGLDVTSQSLAVRERIGYLPENVALYPELRVQEYLDYRAAIKRVPASGRRAQVDEAVGRCGLGDVRRRLVGRLSKGYRQRVALADCLLARPKILILDEPTVGLDPHQIRQVRDLIIELGKHSTILLSSHILPEVEMVCQKVVIIDRGRIVAVDSPHHLRERARAASLGGAVRLQVRADAAEAEASLKQVPGVASVHRRAEDAGFTLFEIIPKTDTDVREALFRLAVDRRWSLRELSQSHVSLEEVFIQLTTVEQEPGA